MQVNVQSRDVDITDELRDAAIEKLSRVRRLFDRFIDMDVTFTSNEDPIDKVHCEVVLHAKGKYLRANASAPDPMAAVTAAEAKLARQVRKFKTKLVSRPRLAKVGEE